MPNHVDNELYIKGKSGVLAVLEAIKGEPADDGTPYLFDCNKVIPYPERFRKLDEIGRAWDKQADEHRKAHANDTPEEREKAWRAFYEKNPRPKDGFNSGGYEWCNQNWGTKWGAYETSFKGDKQPTDKSACIRFNSAWSPPLPVILAMSLKFPDITFRLKFWEGGAGYKGVYACKNGEVIEQSEDTNYRGTRGG